MDGHKYTQFDNDVNIEEVIAEKRKDEEIDKSSKYKLVPNQRLSKLICILMY